MPLGFAFCEIIQTAVFYSLEKEIDMKIWLQNFASSFKLHDSILISVSISDRLPNTSSSQGNNFRYWLLKTRYSTILSRDSMINKHIKQSYTLTEPEHVKQISSSLDTQVYVHPLPVTYIMRVHTCLKITENLFNRSRILFAAAARLRDASCCCFLMVLKCFSLSFSFEEVGLPFLR